MDVVWKKIIQCPVEGAEAIGVTSVRIYYMRMVPCGVIHTGWACGEEEEAARYVGQYAVEDNATRDTVLQVRAWFKDRHIPDVKLKKPHDVDGEIPSVILEQLEA